MKKIVLFSHKFYHYLLPTLLSLLGFSCSGESDIPVEYGSPHATFSIKGKVVDDTNQSPLPNIQVELRYDDEYETDSLYKAYLRDTLYTDRNGEFTWRNEKIPLPVPITIIAKENIPTSFLPDTTIVKFKKEDFVDGGRWYVGKAEKEIIIRMKKENSNE